MILENESDFDENCHQEKMKCGLVLSWFGFQVLMSEDYEPA